ncbi:MAG: hypothetical protein OJF51_003227 [Nitrospira sp.]|nr:MAG: hypothetical protein OJF51_003227 [Nitrospira sp.]
MSTVIYLLGRFRDVSGILPIARNPVQLVSFTETQVSLDRLGIE